MARVNITGNGVTITGSSIGTDGSDVTITSNGPVNITPGTFGNKKSTVVNRDMGPSGATGGDPRLTIPDSPGPLRRVRGRYRTGPGRKPNPPTDQEDAVSTWTVVDPDETTDGQWHVVRDGAVVDRMRSDEDTWEVLGRAEQLAGTELVWRRTDGGGFETALPDPLPGLYVVRDGGDVTIWAENPERPGWPERLLTRTGANDRVFDALAAVLPTRGLDHEG